MSRCRIAREIVVLLIRQHDKFRMRDILREDFGRHAMAHGCAGIALTLTNHDERRHANIF